MALKQQQKTKWKGGKGYEDGLNIDYEQSLFFL